MLGTWGTWVKGPREKVVGRGQTNNQGRLPGRNGSYVGIEIQKRGERNNGPSRWVEMLEGRQRNWNEQHEVKKLIGPVDDRGSVPRLLRLLTVKWYKVYAEVSREC